MFKHTQKYIDEFVLGSFTFLDFRFFVLLLGSLYLLSLSFLPSLNFLWLSPRFISIGQLNTLLHLHLQPINHIVYVESYYLTVWDILS